MEQREIVKLFGSIGFQIDFKSLASLQAQLDAIAKKFEEISKTKVSSVTKALREAQMQELRGLKTEKERLKVQQEKARLASKEADAQAKIMKSKAAEARAQTATLRGQMAQLRAQQQANREAANIARSEAAAARSSTVVAPTSSGRSRRGGYGAGSVARTAATTGGMSGFISGMIGGPGSFARGLIPGLGAGWAVSQIAQQGRRGIGQQTAFQALAGGAEAGKQELGWVRGIANTMGLNQNDVADQYKGFYAAVKNNEVLNKDRKNIFAGFTKYGTALQLNPEQMKGGLRALQQMASKGKITAEELYGQMAEHLPGAAQMFAKALGTSEAQMRKMMERGEVLAEDVLPKVARMLGKAAEEGGGYQKAIKSSAAEQQRFMNVWRTFQEQLFEQGADKGLASFFKAMTPLLETFSVIVTKILLPAIGALAKPLGWLFELVRDFFQLLGVFVESSPKFMAAIGALGLSLYALAGGMGVVVRAITVAFGALYRNPAILGFITTLIMLQDLIYWMLGWKSLMGVMLGKFGEGNKEAKKNFESNHAETVAARARNNNGTATAKDNRTLSRSLVLNEGLSVTDDDPIKRITAGADAYFGKTGASRATGTAPSTRQSTNTPNIVNNINLTVPSDRAVDIERAVTDGVNQATAKFKQ